MIPLKNMELAEKTVPSKPMNIPQIPHYFPLEENEVRCEEALSRENKVIPCSCAPTKAELLRGEGCGVSCINRNLFIECGSHCPSGKYCTNKQFQKVLF